MCKESNTDTRTCTLIHTHSYKYKNATIIKLQGQHVFSFYRMLIFNRQQMSKFVNISNLIIDLYTFNLK